MNEWANSWKVLVARLESWELWSMSCSPISQPALMCVQYSSHSSMLYHGQYCTVTTRTVRVCSCCVQALCTQRCVRSYKVNVFVMKQTSSADRGEISIFQNRASSIRKVVYHSPRQALPCTGNDCGSTAVVHARTTAGVPLVVGVKHVRAWVQNESLSARRSVA